MQDGLIPILENTPLEDRMNLVAPPASSLIGTLNDGVTDIKQLSFNQMQNMLNSALQQDVWKKQDSPLLPRQFSPSEVDTRGRYSTQSLGWDSEDIYGQRQSWWDKMGNGVLKGLALAGTTFLQGTAGLIYGVGAAIGQGEFSKFYDNDFSNTLNDFNNSLENKLPNYYTARERSADWWEPANIFTANFIWDKLVKNLGFSVGAIYSGAAMSKLLGLVPKAFGLSKAGILRTAAAEMESTLSALPATQRAAAAENIILNASKRVNSLNTVMAPAERFLISTLGAATEGGIEALQGVNEWRDQKIKEYSDTYGTIPTGQELERINDTAASLGNARFGMNMALLTTTNYVQLPKILSSSYKESKIIANGVERSISPIRRNLETGLWETSLSTAPKAIKLYHKAANLSGLLFSRVEGIEEFSQFAVQKGVEDYYNKAYKGEGRDWLNSLAQGYADAANSKEGMEQLLIGAVSGGIQQAGFISVSGKNKGFFKTGEIGERGFTGTGGERGKATNDFISSLNKSKNSLKADGWLEAMAKSAARGINLQIEGQNYIRQGDILEAKDNEFDYQHNYLYPRISHGRFDMVQQDIDGYRSLAAHPEGWVKLKQMGIATENDTPATFLARLSAFEKNARNINSLHQSLNVRYGGIVNKDNTRKYSDESIEKMVYAASKVANYDERIPQVHSSLSLHGIATQSIIDNIIGQNKVPEGTTKEALDQINSLSVISDVKDQLKSDLRDVIEMSLRRKSFLKAYDQLKEDPAKYTPVVEPDVNKATKIDDKDVEIGKEYSLAQPLFRDGNKLAISPTLTVLSSTLGGELEVRTPTGETTYKKPKDVSYDLLDTAVTDEQYNTLAEKAIDRVIGEQEGADTLEQKISYINAQDDKELTDAVEEAIIKDTKAFTDQQKKEKEEADKLAKDKEKKAKLKAEQDKLDKLAGVEMKDGATEEEEKTQAFDPNAPLPAFLSKEAAYYNPTAPDSEYKKQQQRRLSFLSVLPTFSVKKAAKIKVLAISASNEASYGLTGLIAYIKDQIKTASLTTEQREQYLDGNGNFRPEQEPIIKVYVIKEKSKLYIVDTAGNKLSALSGNILEELKAQGIFSTFHSTIDGVFKFGDRANQQNYSGEYTEEDVKEANQKLQAWRTNILSSTASPEYSIDQISRGIVLRDDENKPVTATSLATEDDIKNKENIITIPTVEGKVVIGNNTYNYPIGVPILTNGQNVDFLNNRTFSKQEAEQVFKLLRYRVEHSGTKESQRVEDYLSSILYLRSPRKGEAATSDAQIYHSEDANGHRQYHFGPSLSVGFNTVAIDANKESILTFLEGYFVKANNKILTTTTSLGFEEATINDKGELKFISHPSYQHFLLSTKAHSVPFLQTRARRSVSPEDPSIISRYTTLAGNEFEFETKTKPEPEEEEKPKAEKAKTPSPSRSEKIEEEQKGFGKKADKKPKAVAKKAITTTTGDDKYSQIIYHPEFKLWQGYYQDENGQDKGVTGGTKEAVEAEIAKITGQQPTQDEKGTAEEKIARAKKGKPDSDPSEYRFLNETTKYSPIKIEKELAYISAKSPFSVEILKNVIKTSQGIFAWGQFKGMLISLYDKAQEGTGYHELFEGVWKTFTTPEQKAAIVQEFKERNGTFQFFDGKQYHNVEYKYATEFQAKETLADEFAEYVKTREKPQGSKLFRWFKQLLDFITSIFTGKTNEIDQLFAKIDSGHYKSASPLYTDDVSEYSFADLPYTDQYETVQGVALDLIQQLVNPKNKGSISLTEFDQHNLSAIDVETHYANVYEKLKRKFEWDIFTDDFGINENIPLVEAYMAYWENVKQDWTEIRKQTDEYLYSLGIVQGVEQENGELSRLDRDDYSNREYVDDRKYFMNDAKNTASRSVKLLFATIPESFFSPTGELKSVRSATTLMQKPVNYGQTFNFVLSNLLQYNSYGEKMEALKLLSEKFPNVKRLFTRINSVHDNIMHDWSLKTRFYQAMSKQEPTPWIQYNQVNGQSFTSTANLESSRKQIVQSWIDVMKTRATSNVDKTFNINDKGELIIRTSKLKTNTKTQPEKIAFLAQLGIDITEDQLASLPADALREFNLAVPGLAHSLSRRPIFVLENAKSFDAIRNLETIAATTIKAGADVDTIFRNLDGEWQTTRISTNAVSRWANTLNNSEDRKELFEQMPWLANITDSIYLNSILYGEDGKKTKFTIDLGYIQGTEDSNGRAIPGAKLPIFSRLAQEINQNLNGRYYTIIPADAKTQWLVELRNFITYRDVATEARDYKNRVKEKFVEYYNTEKASYLALKETLSEQDLESRRGAFKDISANYTLSDEEFYTAIGEFFNQQIVEQRKLLEDYKVIAPTNTKGIYSWKGLDGDFMKANGIEDARRISGQTITNILTARTINFAINNIEIHKLFFGDTLAYKDAKRWKLFQSPREVSMYDEPEFNTFLNETENEKAGPNALTGQWRFSDNIATAMMEDVIVNNEALYKAAKINATDAQAWSTLVALKERRIKGDTWQDRDEQQYQYSQALDRQLMLEDGIIQTKDNKEDNFYPASLLSRDEELVEKGNPNSSYIYVEKPILSGHVQIDGEWSPITDKFSIVSTSYAAIRTTNFRTHYIKMLKQGIGYIIATSGRKVGKTSPNTFYTPDGSVNSSPYEGIQPVPFSAFGVQTDTSNKKESQTRGSQITKLILINLYENGTAISESIDTLAKHNIALLKAQTEIGYQKLLKSIGAEDVNGRFTITDKRKITALLKDELLKREIADSIKALIGVKADDPTQLIVPFEALPNYIQIKNILYSFVDKYILRPRVNGAPKVQVSGALMEKYGLKKHSINGKDVYTSSSLHFYTEKEPWIDVLLPAWAAQKLRQAGLKWNSTEELYTLFKNSPDAKQLLSGVGFRIPTQELNSVENMRIAGFLPEEMGDTIVVPEEITLKAGSDFDIDKLNSYLQNIYVDNKKQIRIMPYFGIGDEAKKKLKDWIEEDTLRDWLQNEKTIKPSKYESYEEYLLAEPIEDLTAEDLRKDEEKAADAFERMYAQSIENEYYRNMMEILSLKENFQRLVTPNTTATYTDPIDGIRDQLVDLSSVFDSNATPTIISPVYTLKTRHDVLTAKDLVGIAAVAQTGVATRQLSTIIIDINRIRKLFSKRDIEYLKSNDGQPLLPHNSINGVTTMSGIKDVEGNYISDNNSQILNGAVDAFNDAFLSQINYNRRTAPIFHLMIGWGTPDTKAHPIITMFMNQPIIRQYLGLLDVRGKGSNIDKNTIRDIINVYKGLQAPYATAPIEFPKTLPEITEMLKDNIYTHYNEKGKLSLEQKGQQLLVFKEFLKYAVLANNLFRFQQGSSWDTARINDPNSGYFKRHQFENAQTNNAFSDISSYVENSHIGTQMTTVESISTTLSDVLPVQSEMVHKALEPILEVIAEAYLLEDAKNTLSRKLEESLFNFLLQTRGTTATNTSLQNMLVDAKTALALQLKEFKKQPNSTEKIQGNFILNRLIPSIGGKTANATKNITLAIKPRDVFSKNFNNRAFEELYNNPLTTDLAHSLVKISFLQNGVSNSRISFKDAIPAKLYADVVNEIMPALEDEEALKAFISSNTFYKNNWNDENLVDTIYASNDPEDAGIHALIGKNRETGNSGYKPLANMIDILKAQGEIPRDAKPPSVMWINNDEYPTKFVVHQYTRYEGEEKPIVYKRLMQRVEGPNKETFTVQGDTQYDPKKTLYVQVSAWGDSFRAQEHYETIASSVFNNGFLKPGIEIDPISLYSFIKSGAWKQTTQPVEDVAPKPTAQKAVGVREYTPENITSLKPNEVFVFGSNGEGAHGKGAALMAKQKFGAKQGQSEGLQGQSYAVITKKNWRVEKSSTLQEIGKGIQDMLLFAKAHPDKKFLVTKIGSSLAGYKVQEIKDLFGKLKNIIPENVVLPKEYEVRDEKAVAQPIVATPAVSDEQRIQNIIDKEGLEEDKYKVENVNGRVEVVLTTSIPVRIFKNSVKFYTASFSGAVIERWGKPIVVPGYEDLTVMMEQGSKQAYELSTGLSLATKGKSEEAVTKELAEKFVKHDIRSLLREKKAPLQGTNKESMASFEKYKEKLKKKDCT